MANIKDFIKKIGNSAVSLEEQQEALLQVEQTIIEAKAKREESIGKNVDLVISALKTIESKLEAKLDELNNTPAKQGIQGPAGKAGKDGQNGRDGRDGVSGKDGIDGKDGVDGQDGVSVIDAKIDFDGSLVVYLSNGSEIDCGQVLSPDVAQNIIINSGGSGTSQAVTDTLASLQAQIDAIGGGGGSGTVTSVDISGGTTGLTVSGSPITTSGTITLGGTLAIANGGTGATTASAGFNALSPITSTGDLIIGNGTNSATRLAIGTNGYVLTSNGTTVTWAAASGGGGSAATPTTLGTVYGDTDSATPFLTTLGRSAGAVTTGVNNTFVGYEAGLSNTTGVNNNAIGKDSYRTNTTGRENNAFGVGTLFSNTSGADNTAIGHNCLRDNTTGVQNTAIGRDALRNSTTTSYNVGIGFETLLFNAGASNTGVGNGALRSASGSNNAAFGAGAGYVVSSGANNTLIGYQAGSTLTTGSNNILVGYQAAPSAITVSNEATWGNSSTTSNRFWGDFKMAGANAGTSGQVLTSAGAGVAPTWTTPSGGGSAATPTALGTVYAKTTLGSSITLFGYQAGNNVTATPNTFIGYQAGRACTTGNGNVALGNNALVATQTGYDCTAIGASALAAMNNSGYQNTAVGASCLQAVTSGANNTAIGKDAGINITTGVNNSCVGQNARPSTATVSNTVTLGDASITTLRCQVTTITALSDARDKKDITPLQAGIEFIKKLNPVNFIWNMRDGGKVGIADAGFIAQELKQVQIDTGITIPNLVSEENTDRLEAGYGALLPVLVKAIQEQQAQIELLTARITTLEGK